MLDQLSESTYFLVKHPRLQERIPVAIECAEKLGHNFAMAMWHEEENHPYPVFSTACTLCSAKLVIYAWLDKFGAIAGLASIVSCEQCRTPGALANILTMFRRS